MSAELHALRVTAGMEHRRNLSVAMHVCTVMMYGCRRAGKHLSFSFCVMLSYASFSGSNCRSSSWISYLHSPAFEAAGRTMCQHARISTACAPEGNSMVLK